MRHNLFVSLILLSVLPPVAMLAPWRSASCPADSATAGLRACDNDQGAHREATAIEDEELKRRLIREGTRLIQAGRTVRARTLVDQLQLPPNPIPLPAVETGGGSGDLFSQAKASVVVVSALYHCRKCVQMHATSASGFVIAREGVVVTNYHVVEDPSVHTLVVMTNDRRVLPVEQVLAASRADDLAILKVAASDLVPLPLAASSAEAPIGSSVMVISHPDGQYYCCTAGIVSRYFKTRSEGQLVDAVAITADYARGSSGAPVLNARGQVVGVVQSTESIYYTETGQQQRDLQMVFKTCIPAGSLWKLLQDSHRSLQVTQGNSTQGNSTEAPARPRVNSPGAQVVSSEE